MKVILLEKINNLGNKDDIVEVKDNYAINFLIPNKKAITFNNVNLLNLQNKQNATALFHETEKQKSLLIKKQIENINLPFTLKTNAGKIFGSISAKEIISELNKVSNQHFDKKQLINCENFKVFGEFKINIKLPENIIASFSITINSQN